MRIITLAEAIEQGSTPSELRVLANCLERIARQGYDNFGHNEAVYFGLPIDQVESAYSPEDCRRNASALRRLAREVQKAPKPRFTDLSMSMYVNRAAYEADRC